ncbi:MAG: ATP-dependent DNA helicase RecG [Acidimicrobiia bacterium]
MSGSTPTYRSLAYLASVSADNVRGLKGKRARDLAGAGIESVTDLLLRAPRRYIDRSRTVPLADTPIGEEVTVLGEVKDVKTRRPRRSLHITEVAVFDGNSYLFAVWFNQPFRARQLTVGAEVALSGKAARYRGRLQMSSPAVDVLDRPGESLVTGRIVPIHPAAGGVGPGHLRRAVHNALARSRPIADPVPESLLDRLELVDRDTALANIHFPETMEAAAAARRRLVFDEFFRIELALALQKQRLVADAVGVTHVTDGDLVPAFLEGLPFALTAAQVRVMGDINADLGSPHPMHRLLQGEVGSGKTVVAVAALLTAVQGGHQGAVMAPTEVLAEQHYLSIRDLMTRAGLSAPLGSEVDTGSLFASDVPSRSVRLALLTAGHAESNLRTPRATRRDELVAWVADGKIDIVIGTHALIQEGVAFGSLGVAVVDEQHRFGVHQRVSLREKGNDGAQPDMLIMTATPIPRTLSMTLYGDLDVSLLDEMPPDRRPVQTMRLARTPTGEGQWLEMVRDAVGEGHQAFVVCPLVEDSDKIYAASATSEHARLAGILKGLAVGLLHGQMRPAEKEAVMAQMRAGVIDVLVATTVIEVGIDIPNATVMVIEDADRFGLSQLHQLRGRVGRGQAPAVCVLVAEPTTPEGEKRLAAMVATTDGFILAEEDLRIRGQGTVFGARQAGVADLDMADILRDAAVLVEARKEAFSLVAGDPTLGRHADLAEEIQSLFGEDVAWLFIS